METVLLVLVSIVLLWVVVAPIGRSFERRRRLPVVQALGQPPASVFTVDGVDLMEREHDRRCLFYWTDDAMAWQYTRRQDVVRVIWFHRITGYALAYDLQVLAIETADGRHHAWQFRRSLAKLHERELLAAIVRARPGMEEADTLLGEVRDVMGPLEWGP